ncbi:MAG: helix-turn-helix transcriptional regulator [Clostridia bacterium]|nr:helix-turn-helix transcriptional regulator [Clostridia bacterium]
MEYGLSLEKIPTYRFSSFRFFEEHEHHQTRICPYDVIVMIFEGTLRFYEGGVPVEVSQGEYYIQRRGIEHTAPEESDMPKYYYMHFYGDFAEDGSTLPIRGYADFSELFPLFKKLDALRMACSSPVEIAAVFLEILSVLKKKNDRTERNAVVLEVVSMVAENIQKPFLLDEVAAKCGYSKNHVINVFKRETGKTPYAYITDMKLGMAKQLLLYSDSSLAQIGFECGFGDYINFYKAFVKACNEPPLAWKRRKLKEKQNMRQQ